MAVVDICTHNGVAIKLEKVEGRFFGRPKGRDEDGPDGPQAWVRYHDRYTD